MIIDPYVWLQQFGGGGGSSPSYQMPTTVNSMSAGNAMFTPGLQYPRLSQDYFADAGAMGMLVGPYGNAYPRYPGGLSGKPRTQLRSRPIGRGGGRGTPEQLTYPYMNTYDRDMDMSLLGLAPASSYDPTFGGRFPRGRTGTGINRSQMFA